MCETSTDPLPDPHAWRMRIRIHEAKHFFFKSRIWISNAKNPFRQCIRLHSFLLCFFLFVIFKIVNICWNVFFKTIYMFYSHSSPGPSRIRSLIRIPDPDCACRSASLIYSTVLSVAVNICFPLFSHLLFIIQTIQDMYVRLFTFSCSFSIALSLFPLRSLSPPRQ